MGLVVRAWDETPRSASRGCSKTQIIESLSTACALPTLGTPQFAGPRS